MPILSDSFLQEVRMRTDISELISSYVTLRKRGNTSIGLCPFHNEKTPSFTVYEDTQSFYCFGCGVGGDAVTFVKKIENLDYLDAVKLLAERAGMQMPEESTYDDTLAKMRRKVLEVNRATAKFYHSYMMSEEGRVGLEYFLSRGLSRKTIQHFGLGYAPNDWHSLEKHLKTLGFKQVEMQAAGVIKQGKKGYYDTFVNRVMTPIIDVRGNVIAFGGRVLDDSKPKYMNSADSLVYKKTFELFGLNFAKDSSEDSIILCEGYMDVIAMHQAGFTNAVAGCGTALTPEQVRLISRYAKEVVLIYDNDEAGQKALNKAIRLFEQTDVKISIPRLSGGKDPDEIIHKLGKERFASMIENSSSEVEFALVEARSKYDLQTTRGKSLYANDAVKILSTANPIERDLYLSRISEELGIEKKAIQAQLDHFLAEKKKNSQKQNFKKIIDNDMLQMRKESHDSSATPVMLKAEQRIIGLLLTHPDCIKFCDELSDEMLSEGFYRKAYQTVTQRIKENMSLDLIVFNENFSDEEMSKLTKIIHSTQGSSNPKQEFKDCVNVVKKEFDKNNKVKASELDDDAFRSMFKNKNT